MNRRQFTASLGAACAAPLAPMPSLAAAPAAPALPAGRYMWADFIARARGHVDAGFLARRLGLTSGQAQALVTELTAKGVIKAAPLGGVAHAVKPIRYPTNANGGLATQMLKPASHAARSPTAPHKKFAEITDTLDAEPEPQDKMAEPLNQPETS